MNGNSNSVGVILLLLLVLGKAAQGGGPNSVLGSTGLTEFGAEPFQGSARRHAAVPPPAAFAQGFPDTAAVPSATANNFRRTAPLPHPAALARDFHRMVGIMGKVDRLGQLAAAPPKLPPISDISELANLSNLGNLSSLSELSKLSEPDALINTSALPDMNSLMEMFAPIINSLKTGE